MYSKILTQLVQYSLTISPLLQVLLLCISIAGLYCGGLSGIFAAFILCSDCRVASRTLTRVASSSHTMCIEPSSICIKHSPFCCQNYMITLDRETSTLCTDLVTS